MNAIVKADTSAEVMENVLIRGDIGKLTVEERGQYYYKLCQSLGLNALTQPFEYIQLNGKLRLYAKKDCTDQLRSVHGVSVTDLVESEREGVFIVKAKVLDAKGRTDVSTGAVNIKGLAGEALANALMKAETKAKRRATLSICGLGMLDETEVEDIPAAQKTPVERPRVPSPSDAPRISQPVQQSTPIVQQPKPEEGPHKIVGGTYGSWSDTFLEAIGTAGDPATVMAWIDANQPQLAKLAAGSPDDAARVKAATDKHLQFLRKTTPKSDPISTGRPAEAQDEFPGDTPMDGAETVKPAPAKRTRASKAPDFAKDYDGWLAWQLKLVAAAKTPERIEEIYEALDPLWSDIMEPDRETLMGARREAEGKLEQ